MNAKHKIVAIIAAAGLALLGGCKSLQETAASKTFTPPEGVVLMSEAELRKTLVGNTYEGESVRYPGNSYVEFIAPDGTIRGLWNGTERYQGEWVISGQVWCYRYESSNGCNTLARSGDTISWYALDGTAKGGKSVVIAGDPQNLNQ